MKYSVNELNKFVRGLCDRIANNKYKIDKYSTFNCSLQENVEDARPKYDVLEAMKCTEDLEAKMRKIKHAINVHNTTVKPTGYNMTIDEILVYIPQLVDKKAKLETLSLKQEKERAVMNGFGTPTIIDYTYINFDHDTIEKMYNETIEELSNIYAALDESNCKKLIEIDLD